MAHANDIYIASYCMLSPFTPAETRAPLVVRLDAVARAGFAGTSLDWDEVKAVRQEEGTLSGLKRRLNDAGVRAPQMDYLSLLNVGDGSDFPVMARDITECSGEFGCEVIHVLGTDKAASFETLLDRLGLLARFCTEAGVKCAVEFVPAVTGIEDLSTALRLVRGVGLAAVGLVADSLHFYRAGAPWAELDGLKPGEVLTIQINDGRLGPPGPDYVEETLAKRLLPGDGAFDLRRFVGALAKSAPDVPLTAEVINVEMQQRLSPDALAQLIADRTRALLAYR